MSSPFLGDAIENGWLLAARVDLLRGEVLERRDAGEGPTDRDDVLLAAIEMLRSGLRPKQLFLFAGEFIHFYERSDAAPHLATVLIAHRTRNIGLLLSELRQLSREPHA